MLISEKIEELELKKQKLILEINKEIEVLRLELNCLAKDDYFIPKPYTDMTKEEVVEYLKFLENNELKKIQLQRVGYIDFESYLNGSRVGSIKHSGDKKIGVLFNNLPVDLLKEVIKNMNRLNTFPKRELKNLKKLLNKNPKS